MAKELKQRGKNEADVVLAVGLPLTRFSTERKVSFIEYRAEFENESIRVEFSKTDDSGETEIEGAELSVIDSEGNVVETSLTAVSEKCISTLQEAGKSISLL